MKNQILIIALAVCAAHAARRDYNVEQREPVRHSFSADKSLDVDAVNGSITVIGDGGNTIRVEGERIVRAGDAAEAERAKREVVLDVNEKDGIAQLYVNGPFRENGHASEYHGFHDHRDREYEVTYNFTIRVPRETDLRLHTINGQLKTQDTSGKFDLHNINGGIEGSGVAGSGRADTLNGSTV